MPSPAKAGEGGRRPGEGVLLAAICFFIASSILAQPLPPLPFDHILRYDEMTKLLHGWADARPNLVEL
ncbi:MAG: hypothetical protein ACXVH7_11875, partial [Thermoanaerobaculia bacterium]